MDTNDEGQRAGAGLVGHFGGGGYSYAVIVEAKRARQEGARP